MRQQRQQSTERMLGRWLRVWWAKHGDDEVPSVVNAAQFCEDVARGWEPDA